VGKLLNPAEVSQQLAQQLSALGYPGFASMRAAWHRNPAEVVLYALAQTELEPRVAEALPWVLLHYPDMDHQWLLSQARLNNLSNRLGFTVSLARRAAERHDQQETVAYEVLTALEEELSKSRLDLEDDFGNPSMSAGEREWVRSNRSADAEYWHVVTDWRPEHLQHV
jgi:hypothetical protein